MKHVMEIQTIVSLSGRNIIKEELKMNNTVEALKNRIHKLQERDPVMNMRLINKLKRRLRAIESK